MATDYNVANLNGLSISELFEEEELLRYLMHTIGINAQRSRNKIISDGFQSISEILKHHANDVKGFKNYLLQLNKTFASASNATLRVYYSPLVIARFVGIIHFYNQAVNTLHCIPDPSYIDIDMADELSQQYQVFLKISNKESEEVDIEIPTLTGATNWVDFIDKVKMKLGMTIGTRGIPLSYVIDTTERNVTRANALLTEIDLLDLSDESIFTTQATHFGSAFKRDNSQVWLVIKALLIGTLVYNHVCSNNTTSNGRKAWLAQTNFYEGQDFKTRMKDAAFSKMMQTFYRGDTPRYSFEKYINAHKEAHKMLEDSGYNDGVGLDDSTKCHHFIAGIKEQAGIEHALCLARSNPQYRNFVNLISFLQSEIDHKNLRKQQLQVGKQ